MVYDLSHLLLGVVRITKVQDPYLIMMPYSVSSAVALFSMVNSLVAKIFPFLWRHFSIKQSKERERTLSPGLSLPLNVTKVPIENKAAGVIFSQRNVT